MLLGCSDPGPQRDLDEYLEKLERVLEQGAHPIPERSIPNFPQVRDLRLDLPESSIDILEFLQIGRCELQQLVATRNSSLGKLAEASQRLVYEIEFLRVGEQCRMAIADDHPELAARLSEVLTIKRAQLPHQIFLATLGGQEFRRFWQTSGNIPTSFDEDGALVIALTQLVDDVTAWRDGDYRVDASRLENQLDVIRRASAGAQLQAWMLLANKMDVASKVIEDRRARTPLCHEGMQPPRARIFDTVVRDVFIGRIQPWAAGLNARYYELFPLVRRLESLLVDATPAAYRMWEEERDARLSWATDTLVRHVNALNPLFEQCNLLPTRGDGL